MTEARSKSSVESFSALTYADKDEVKKSKKSSQNKRKRATISREIGVNMSEQADEVHFIPPHPIPRNKVAEEVIELDDSDLGSDIADQMQATASSQDMNTGNIDLNSRKTKQRKPLFHIERLNRLESFFGVTVEEGSLLLERIDIILAHAGLEREESNLLQCIELLEKHVAPALDDENK